MMKKQYFKWVPDMAYIIKYTVRKCCRWTKRNEHIQDPDQNHENIEDMSIRWMYETSEDGEQLQQIPAFSQKFNQTKKTYVPPPLPSKSNNRDSKDPVSHSISADRRHSVIKANKTEANFETEDFDPAIDQLILGLRSIPQPPCLNAKLMNKYFSDLRRYFSSLDGPFHRLCLQLHSFYVNPMQKFLDLVSPMEQAIRRKQQVSRQIDRQIIQNEELYSKLEPIDIEIFKLKEKIEENRVLIEQKRHDREERSRGKENHVRSQHSQIDESPSPPIQPEERLAKAEPIGRGFKLDLNNIGKDGQLGYHQQFYSKIDEFSQSWRDQAMREKRF